MTLSKVQKAERRVERLKLRALRLRRRAEGARADYLEAERELRWSQRERYLEMRSRGELSVPVAEEETDEFFG